jgi:hypothetical protein
MHHVAIKVSRLLSCGGLALLAAACGGGAGADQGEWSAHESSALLCQDEGIHLEGCPITKPPPVTGACPPGDGCAVSQAASFLPINGCGPVMVLKETGPTPSFTFFAQCSPAAATAWLATLPAFWSGTTTTVVPTLPVLAGASGQVYATFAPQGCSGVSACEIPVDHQGGLLPCTAFESLSPSLPPRASQYFASTCVDTAAVLAEPGSGYNVGLSDGPGNPLNMPALPAGYVYMDYFFDPDIGGGCGNACRGY